ncbi:MAG TPA: hypothetical protein VLC74_12910, partial [Rhizomicrobium sp.]|nr:hypothetical protein [Rhizomicrobium sp.]
PPQRGEGDRGFEAMLRAFIPVGACYKNESDWPEHQQKKPDNRNSGGYCTEFLSRVRHYGASA